MRRFAIAAIAALIALPAIGQWTRSHQSDTGTWVCAGPDGAEYDTLYDGAGAATIYCNGMAAAQRFIESVLGMSVAEAALNVGALQECSDGRFYVQDPDCSEVGTGTDFAWTGSVPNFQGLTEDVDTIGPYDLTTHCVEASPPGDCDSVTYSLLTVSGTACETGASQFAISMGSLSNDGTVAGAGSCRVQMDFDGDTVNGNIWSWEFGAAPGTDEIAPTQIQGCEITTDADSVNYDCPPAIDAGGSGMATVEVRDDGTLVDTINVSQGLQLDHSTLVEMGTTGSPMYTGGDLEFAVTSCAGEGLPFDADDGWCAGTLRSITGDFSWQFCVATADVTTDADFSSSGMLFHATGNTADRRERYFGHWKQVDTAETNIRGLHRWRSTVSGTATTSNPGVQDYDCFRGTRVGDIWTGYAKDAADLEYEETMTGTNIPLPTTLFGGPFLSASDVNSTVTSTITEAGITNAPNITGSYETMSQASLTFTACDADDNCAAPSVAYVATPGTPSAGDGRRWVPGVFVQENAYSGSQLSLMLNTIIPEICDMPNVVGVHMLRRWPQLETSEGVYDLSAIQQVYDAISACEKYLVVQPQGVRFNGNNCPDTTVPAYMQTAAYDGGATLTSDGNQCWAMFHKAPVMERYIALKAAIAEQFDDLPYYYGTILSETAVNAIPTNVTWSSGSQSWSVAYSGSAFLTQVEAAIEACEVDFQQANCVLYFNYLRGVNVGQYHQLHDFMKDHEVLYGGPDLLPTTFDAIEPIDADRKNPSRNRTAGQCVRLGINSGDAGDACNVQSNTGEDYRDSVGCYHSIQTPEMGGRSANGSMLEFVREVDNIGCGNVAVWRKTSDFDAASGYADDEDIMLWGGNPNATQETEGVKAFINNGDWLIANPGCPPNYASCQ